MELLYTRSHIRDLVVGEFGEHRKRDELGGGQLCYGEAPRFEIQVLVGLRHVERHGFQLRASGFGLRASASAAERQMQLIR